MQRLRSEPINVTGCRDAIRKSGAERHVRVKIRNDGILSDLEESVDRSSTEIPMNFVRELCSRRIELESLRVERCRSVSFRSVRAALNPLLNCPRIRELRIQRCPRRVKKETSRQNSPRLASSTGNSKRIPKSSWPDSNSRAA